MTTSQIRLDLQKLARGKKLSPGKLTEYKRDGYIEIDEYDSITYTPRGAALRNGKVPA